MFVPVKNSLLTVAIPVVWVAQKNLGVSSAALRFACCELVTLRELVSLVGKSRKAEESVEQSTSVSGSRVARKPCPAVCLQLNGECVTESD